MAEAVSRIAEVAPSRRRIPLGFEAGAAFLARGPAPLPVVSRAGDAPDALRGGVVLLGNFDGFHKGHQALRAHGKALAERSAAPLGVMSVEPHPRQFFGRNAGPFRLTSPAIKLVILREQGFDFVYAPAFDARFAAITAETFVERVLVEGLQIRHAVVGHDFQFGHQRRGTTDLLIGLGRRHGFGVTRVAAERTNEAIYSSNLVRELIAAGDLAAANAALGHRWMLEVASLEGLASGGWRLRFAGGQLLPPAGCYPVRLVSATNRRRCLGEGRLMLSSERGPGRPGEALFLGRPGSPAPWGASPAVEFLG
jgi:riboflavin kinase/FMN adenylyltransferase